MISYNITCCLLRLGIVTNAKKYKFPIDYKSVVSSGEGCTLVNNIIYALFSPPANVHHYQFLPCEQIPKGLSSGICLPKLRAF